MSQDSFQRADVSWEDLRKKNADHAIDRLNDMWDRLVEKRISATDRDLLERIMDDLARGIKSGQGDYIKFSQGDAFSLLCFVDDLLKFKGNIEVLQDSRARLRAARDLYKERRKAGDRIDYACTEVCRFLEIHKPYRTLPRHDRQNIFMDWYWWQMRVKESPVFEKLKVTKQRSLLAKINNRNLERLRRKHEIASTEAVYQIIKEEQAVFAHR